MKLKVGTLNCKGYNKKRSSIDEHNLKVFLENENFDVLGFQEMTPYLENKLDLSGYNMYGKYRFGKNIFVKFIPILRRFNENNRIVSKYKAKSVITYKLPFIPDNLKELKKSIFKMSLIPRITTICILNIYNKDICCINTHLSYDLIGVQKRQLEFLKKKIFELSLKYPIILTGDFNLDLNDNLFKDFVFYLEGINIKRIPVDTKTSSSEDGKTLAIDHIFVSNSFKVYDYGIMDNQVLKNITDHLGVYVNLKV